MVVIFTWEYEQGPVVQALQWINQIEDVAFTKLLVFSDTFQKSSGTEKWILIAKLLLEHHLIFYLVSKRRYFLKIIFQNIEMLYRIVNGKVIFHVTQCSLVFINVPLFLFLTEWHWKKENDGLCPDCQRRTWFMAGCTSRFVNTAELLRKTNEQNDSCNNISWFPGVVYSFLVSYWLKYKSAKCFPLKVVPPFVSTSMWIIFWMKFVLCNYNSPIWVK